MPGDANAMVGERGVHAGHFDSGHVAADAILPAHGTRLAGFFARCVCPGHSVAREALPVIGCRIAHKWFMRIMASDADQARVASTPAPAVFQAVRLEPHIGHAGYTRLNDVAPCPVASSAEIDRCNSVQPARIENRVASVFDFSCLHSRHVLGTRSVAGLARHTKR